MDTLIVVFTYLLTFSSTVRKFSNNWIQDNARNRLDLLLIFIYLNFLRNEMVFDSKLSISTPLLKSAFLEHVKRDFDLWTRDLENVIRSCEPGDQ